MQMFSALLRAQQKEGDKKLYHIAIMPRTAKKMEAGRSEFTHDGQPDVDLVLTTQELIRMIKEAGIRFNELPDEAPDMPFGLGTGAGVIFGTTGGVAEAVVRRVMESESRNTLQEIAYSGVRGMEGVRAVELPVGEKTIRVGIVHGLKNARQLIAKMEAGEEHFDLVEVMTCTTGCVGGAGQPIGRKEQKYARAKGLYEADRKTLIKSSQHNPISRRSMRSCRLRRRTSCCTSTIRSRNNIPFLSAPANAGAIIPTPYRRSLRKAEASSFLQSRKRLWRKGLALRPARLHRQSRRGHTLCA